MRDVLLIGEDVIFLCNALVVAEAKYGHDGDVEEAKEARQLYELLYKYLFSVEEQSQVKEMR
jgi:hypothetical protein